MCIRDDFSFFIVLFYWEQYYLNKYAVIDIDNVYFNTSFSFSNIYSFRLEKEHPHEIFTTQIEGTFMKF